MQYVFKCRASKYKLGLTKPTSLSLEERRTLSYFRYGFSGRIESVDIRNKLHSSGIQDTSCYGKREDTEKFFSGK